MIKVFIPQDYEFKQYKKELKQLYESCQNKICDPNDFDFIVNNTLFYGFADSGNLLGALYFFCDSGNLYVNGFGSRKHFDKNIECLKLSLTWFSCDIYAEAQNRASALCLLKAGFRRVKDKLFLYNNASNQNIYFGV